MLMSIGTVVRPTDALRYITPFRFSGPSGQMSILPFLLLNLEGFSLARRDLNRSLESQM